MFDAAAAAQRERREKDETAAVGGPSIGRVCEVETTRVAPQTRQRKISVGKRVEEVQMLISERRRKRGPMPH
jgi:hypothetical protein